MEVQSQAKHLATNNSELRGTIFFHPSQANLVYTL